MKQSLFFFLLVTVFLLSIQQLYAAVSVCGVTSNEEFLIKDSLGNKIFSVDKTSGNFILYSLAVAQSATSFPALSGNDFLVQTSSGTKLFQADKDNAYLLGYIIKTTPATPNGNDFSIKNSGGTTLLTIEGTSGNINVLGTPVYEGAQAGCSADGWYCNGAVRENRDYYCAISSLACTYNVNSYEDCLTKISNDLDGGNYPLIGGYVKDYTGCSGGSCTYSSHPDSCINADLLIEYYPNGDSYTSSTIDCNSYDGCNGDTLEDYSCVDTTYDYCGVFSSTACSTGASDSDGGDSPLQQGTCTDYTGCSGGSCTQTTHTDYCGGSKLYEYYVSNGVCVSRTYLCNKEFGTTCSNGACGPGV